MNPPTRPAANTQLVRSSRKTAQAWKVRTMAEVGAALLMLVGPIAMLVLLVLVPVAFGVMAFDLIAARKVERATVAVVDSETTWQRSTEAAESRIYLERGIARAFVIAGGVFWAIAAFAGWYSFRDAGGARAFLAAGIPLVATLVTLIVGWYWERIAAAMLALASIGAIYYGVVTGFDVGVWLLVTLTMIGPMMTAAVLFWLARREYEALEFRLAHRELSTVSVKGSSY